MAQRENPDIENLIAGALDWWREAGVDCAFHDEPTGWLAPPQTPRGDPPPPAERARPAPPSALPASAGAQQPPAAPQVAIPDTLDAFVRWWMTEPSLAEGATSARVAPRGPQGAELMVIVPEPEATDRDTLLSGPQGRLLDSMLRAFGLAPGETYFASALARHSPGADWDALARGAAGATLARHIALAAPKRVAVFGANVLPLIGNGPPQGPADLRNLNHEETKLPLLAARSLAALAEQPRWKAKVWQAWLGWAD